MRKFYENINKFNICDAIQQKVRKEPVRIDRGDSKEQLEKISGAGSASEERYFGP